MQMVLKKIRQFFLPLGFIFVATTFTGAYFSDNVSTTNNTFVAGTWSVTPTTSPSTSPIAVVETQILINEFVANAVGADDATMPNGEWVELYNSTDEIINVNGWYVYDSSNTNELIISGLNTEGSLNMAPGGYLVVYRNSDNDFELGNTVADSARLFNGPISSGTMIDSFSYLAGTVVEDRSWARFPNGSSTWVQNQIPTKGTSN